MRCDSFFFLESVSGFRDMVVFELGRLERVGRIGFGEG